MLGRRGRLQYSGFFSLLQHRGACCSSTGRTRCEVERAACLTEAGTAGGSLSIPAAAAPGESSCEKFSPRFLLPLLRAAVAAGSRVAGVAAWQGTGGCGAGGSWGRVCTVGWRLLRCPEMGRQSLRSGILLLAALVSLKGEKLPSCEDARKVFQLLQIGPAKGLPETPQAGKSGLLSTGHRCRACAAFPRESQGLCTRGRSISGQCEEGLAAGEGSELHGAGYRAGPFSARVGDSALGGGRQAQAGLCSAPSRALVDWRTQS